MSPQSKSASDAGPGDALGAALADVGQALGAREADHREALEAARAKAVELHARVERALGRYHEAIEAAGAPHLRVDIGAPRLDEKHVRSWEFELRRGRWRGLFVLKSRGELTLVGPFRTGKTEGPCKSFPFAPPGTTEPEIDAAPVKFVTHFLEEAATP